MTTLSARLDKLETLANPKEAPLILILVRPAGTESGDDLITGIRGDGDRLPALQRQQGETLDALTNRARAMIIGDGLVVAHYLRDPVPILP